ncbi:hypothetical protein [Cryobacterium algoricola]|nr:hypothetical protein [Cryobacterium algoricola]
MNPRIENTPENQMVSTIANMRTTVNELRAVQNTSTTALKTYLNQTPSAYDKSFTMSTYGQVVTFSVTFTGAIQTYPITSLIYQVFMNSMSNEVYPGSSTAAPTCPLVDIHQRPPSTGSKATVWDVKVTMNDSATETCFFKFFVQSTDNGGITVS